MGKSKWIVVLVFLVTAAQPGFADDRALVQGVWKEEKAALLDSLVAYTGTYRVEGDKWITSVEVAWNPAWVGTEQSRSFKVMDHCLQVLTPWRVMPNWPDKGMTRSIITFERVK